MGTPAALLPGPEHPREAASQTGSLARRALSLSPAFPGSLTEDKHWEGVGGTRETCRRYSRRGLERGQPSAPFRDQLPGRAVLAGNFNPTAAPWSSPHSTLLGVPQGVLTPVGAWQWKSLVVGGATSAGCHPYSGATSAWMPPPPRCHFCSGAATAQLPALLRCHLCLGTTSTQMPPKSWVLHLLKCHLRLGSTSAQVPPPLRCHPQE